METAIHSAPTVSRNYAVANGAKPTLEEYLEKYQAFSHPAVLLSCGISFRRLRMVNDFTMARAFHRAWTCQPLKQKKVPHIALCHVDGVIKKIYKDLVWYPDSVVKIEEQAQLEPSRFSGFVEMFRNSTASQWAFAANEAPEYSHLLDLDLRPHLTQRGMANPVRYVFCN